MEEALRKKVAFYKGFEVDRVGKKKKNKTERDRDN
jgi:hypothetical protein